MSLRKNKKLKLHHKTQVKLRNGLLVIGKSPVCPAVSKTVR